MVYSVLDHGNWPIRFQDFNQKKISDLLTSFASIGLNLGLLFDTISFDLTSNTVTALRCEIP